MECQGWPVGTDILFINIFISRLNNVNMGLVSDHSQPGRDSEINHFYTKSAQIGKHVRLGYIHSF